MASPRLSIVIPCFNEEDSLPHLLEELSTVVADLATVKRSCEVIIVDDGSRDGSYDIVAQSSNSMPWLRAIRLRRNYGQTAAMSAGFDAARGEFIIPMDADMQNDPADISKLLDKLESGYDVVSGWRKNRQDKLWTRKLPSWIANRIIGAVTGVRLHDYGCTLKVYRAEYLKGIRIYGEMHRFLPVYAKWEGARITEMVVHHRAREYGQSKYGLGRTFKVLLDLITVKFLGDYATKPLYMFGRPGLLLCFLGMLSAGGALAEKIWLGTWVHRNPLALLAVLLVIVGVQLIGMGLIAELQVRTYHESQSKPIYKIRAQTFSSSEAACAELPASSPQARSQSTDQRSSA